MTKTTLLLDLFLDQIILIIVVHKVVDVYLPASKVKIVSVDQPHISLYHYDSPSCHFPILMTAVSTAISRLLNTHTFSTLTVPSFSSPLDTILADLSAVSAGYGTSAASPSKTTAICSSE